MKIFSRLTSVLISLLCCSLNLFGEQQFRCVKEGREYCVYSKSGKYVVECTGTSSAASSRSKNIQDRKFRLDAIDLMGCYILFMQSSLKSEADLFQLFVETSQLHYQADIYDLEREDVSRGKDIITVYRCKTDKYNISHATYRKDLDIDTLLSENYRRRKDADAVELMAKYHPLSITDWLMVEKDYLLGNSSIPGFARKLQEVPDRLEQSIFMDNDNVGEYKGALPNKPHYRVFFLEDIVTSLPTNKKGYAYRLWVKSLDNVDGIMPELLRFCAKNRPSGSLPKDAVLTDVIEAFPGALSPWGIRAPIDSRLYDEAVKAYSNSDFQLAADLLTEHINNNGIQPVALNLLGASLRYLRHPKRALPYLLLCLKLEPNTPYVVGNIYLCLTQSGFHQGAALKTCLDPLANDSWSIEMLTNKN